MRVAILLALVLSVVSGTGLATLPGGPVPNHSPFVPEGYGLVFADEFRGASLNLETWQHRYVNQPYLAGYNTERSIVQPGDGMLHLVTDYENGQFLTGMIQSVERFRYGYFEARIRFQSLQGHHGALWLQSPLYGQVLDDPAGSGAEIDIIEFFGSGRSATDAQHNLYWNPYSSEHLQKRSHDVFYRDRFGQELSDDFHVFGFLWTPEAYGFTIDGVETWRTDEGLSHTEQYIVLSLITSAWENGRLDSRRLPDAMRVDYVRVYKAVEQTEALS